MSLRCCIYHANESSPIMLIWLTLCFILDSLCIQTWSIRGSRGGGQGVRTPPLKNHKNMWFYSNTGPDPLKISKLPSQHSIVVFGSSLPSSTKKIRCQSWTLFSKTSWIRACEAWHFTQRKRMMGHCQTCHYWNVRLFGILDSLYICISAW